MSNESSVILLPLRGDIQRLTRMLAFLETESEHATRADLAEELVRERALLEDTKQRALIPFLNEAGFTEAAERMHTLTEEIRSAMEPVFKAVHHTAPIDVHLHEPEMFERNVTQLCRSIRANQVHENMEIAEIDQRLLPDQRRLLIERLRSARRRAVARPHPAHNPMLRLLERVFDGIERRFPDTPDQYRPGRNKLAS